MKQQKFKWDKWQKEVIEHKGSVTVRAGRQSGKSESVSKRISDQMIDYPETQRLIIAPSDRQSSQLFIKTQAWLRVKHQELLKEAGGFKPNSKNSIKVNLANKRHFEYINGIYNEYPTKELLVLKKDFKKPPSEDNVGSMCYALPAGRTGVYLRTFALDFLDIDEAAYVPESVYNAVKPMLAVSAKTKGLGWETLLSTPYGKGGFFYQSHHSDDYKQFHVSAENCPRIGKDFLRKERARLTKAEYNQEYLALFSEAWNQFFQTKLIKECMTFMEWSLARDRRANSRLYLGVDVARYGGDENAFVIVELVGTKLKCVKVITTARVSTTDTIGRIQELERLWKFNKIFIDDAGVGGSLTDVLMDKLGRKVMGLNNASKRVQVQGEERKKGILKEDLYSNTLMLMETGKLELINHLGMLKSLKSIIYEYGEMKFDRKIKIYGQYSHITEALVRACWCIKERGLGLYIY